MADTGFIICGTGADDSSVGTITWSNPGNVTADDGSRARATLNTGETSHYLKATNYTNGLPAGATIDGIEVQYEGHVSVSFPDVDSVRLVNDVGSIVGDDKGDGRDWKAGNGLDQFGGAADLWGTTPSKADLDDTDSGWVISAQAPSNAVAWVDAMWRKIYYTEGGGGRIMSSLVNAGGLAGVGGIAGQGGGLAN